MTMLLVDYSNQSAILHFDQISCLSHSESAPQFFDVPMSVGGSPRWTWRNGFLSPRGLHTMIVGTIGGYDAKISNTFTSAKNLVVFRRPPVMQNS